jgi:hypothetical protein
MKIVACLIAFMLFAVVPSAAQAQLASESLVRELMEVTKSRQMLDEMWGQMDGFLQEAMRQALAGRTPSPEQQAALDEMTAKLVALLQTEMRWELLEPRFLEIYQQTFTEEEVAGMLDFYRSPAGQAVIDKMPQVMERSLGMMHGITQSMMPKLRQIQSETIEKLKQGS